MPVVKEGFTPTEEQQQLLAHDPGNHGRVLAGPGTGKSFTLVAFLEKLLSLDEPPKVKLLTFTRAATNELAQKVATIELAGDSKPSTVHSFAISVLLKNPGTADFPRPLRMADEWEQKNVVRPTLGKRLGVTPTKVKKLVSKMAANWESLEGGMQLGVSEEEKAQFLGAWNEHRRVYGYTLVQELPHALLQALRNHDELTGTDFDMLLVDEYQDLNACDLAVLHELASRGCKVIAAGDDDQSIYSFRHAHPAGIREFPQQYEEAGDYTLSRPLRCGRRIVEWANFVIVGDPDRPADRAVLTPADAAEEGDVALLRFPGHVSEVNGVARLTKELIDEKGLAPSDILILVRSDHNQGFSRPLREKLEAEGIACSDPNVVQQVLDEPVNRGVLATLRLLSSDRDSLAWATLLNLTRGIGDRFFEYIYSKALPTQIWFAEALLAAHADEYPDAPAGPARGKAQELVANMLRWLEEEELPTEVPDNGWHQWILERIEAGELSKPSDEFLELLHAVEEELDGTASLSLDSLLSQLQPVGKDLYQSRAPGVRIMTMVGSKGLTVEAAILVGVEEDVIPLPNCDVNEERRILYVAMTRAKKFLFTTWAGQRRGQTARAGTGQTGQARNYSRFLLDGPVQSQDGDAYSIA